MRGVYFNKQRSRWVARYQNKDNNIPLIRRYFKKEDDAILKRKEWENNYGDPENKSEEKYAGFENNDWKIIGATGEKTKNGAPLVVVINKNTGKPQINQANTIVSGKLKSNSIQYGTRHKRSGYKGIYLSNEVWIATVSLNNKKYWLGSFVKKEAAIKAREKALSDFGKHNILPKKSTRPRKDNKLGEKNISYDSKKHKYIFEKVINKKQFAKTFKHLSDAIAYKHEFLKEHGLTE